MSADGTRVNGPVVAVIVTYNRRDLLQECLAAVLGQTLRADRVIVVDNASSDGTARAVRESFPTVELITLTRNTGGAGGFAVALDAAAATGAGGIWLLDDDVMPEPGALAALIEARDAYPAGVPTALASHVVWINGETHPMNIPRRVLRASRAVRAAAEATGGTPIRTASFCSLLLDADVVRAEGLPIAAYFIWNDDVEYTARLLRGRVGLLCPASVAVHKTADFYNSVSSPGPRFFYDVRNTVWMLARSRGLARWERIYHAAASIDRWSRAFLRARERGSFARTAARGVFAALRSGPEPTEDVLADVWDFHAHAASPADPTRPG